MLQHGDSHKMIPASLRVSIARILQIAIPRVGYELVKSISLLAGAEEVVLTHHERFDGSGYPQKMKGEEIPFGARIFAVADTLDAGTSNRPYRAALPLQVARDVIERGSGTLFDPLVVATSPRAPSDTWQTTAKQTVTVHVSSVLAAQRFRLPLLSRVSAFLPQI
jgi:HD-GYP domain-containing protein (c-di-GMP phosphodiesterase class II)